jgi:hypothetical protein
MNENVFDLVFGKKKVEEKPSQVPSPSPPPPPSPMTPSPPAPISTPTFEAKPEGEKVEVAPPTPIGEEKKALPSPAPSPAFSSEEFDLSEDKGMGKIVIVIYGLKGNGKTYAAMTLPGSVDVISFDRKALMVKNILNKPGIRVFDGIRYMNWEDTEKVTESAERTYAYLNKLLDEIAKNPPDWIVIDGSEIFQTICEYVMRYRNNILPFQGIANLNLWKERRLYIRQIHQRCIQIAKRGLVYTTYVDKDEIVEDGEIRTKKDVPRWIDAILYETDIVIKVEGRQQPSGRQFIAEVESSKYPNLFRTGTRLDITNKGLSAFLGGGQ